MLFRSKWSWQTVKGMKFLAESEIAHGDLATRNLLLDSGLNVKICDFGLSRQLYFEYRKSTYVGAPRVAPHLPWRSIAPEALLAQQTGVSVNQLKCDVYSFGVLMWEIFTLGEQPYGDIVAMRQRDLPKFAEELRSGLRGLSQPLNAPQEM